MEKLLTALPPWLLPAALVVLALWILQPVLTRAIDKIGGGQPAGPQVFGELARAVDRLAVVLETNLAQQGRATDEIRQKLDGHKEVLDRLDYRTREIRDRLVGEKGGG